MNSAFINHFFSFLVVSLLLDLLTSLNLDHFWSNEIFNLFVFNPLSLVFKVHLHSFLTIQEIWILFIILLIIQFVFDNSLTSYLHLDFFPNFYECFIHFTSFDLKVSSKIINPDFIVSLPQSNLFTWLNQFKHPLNLLVFHHLVFYLIE